VFAQHGTEQHFLDLKVRPTKRAIQLFNTYVPCGPVKKWSLEVLEDRISDYFRILMKVWSLIIIVRRR
jgi:hypothetical protein